jgi:hypothetical protein
VAEIQIGDHVVDGDGHLWRVLRLDAEAVEAEPRERETGRSGVTKGEACDRI